jgi:hypothetical protein
MVLPARDFTTADQSRETVWRGQNLGGRFWHRATARIALAKAFRTQTGLYRHSNQSLFAGVNSAGKRFGDARDWAGFFSRHLPIPGGRDRAMPRLRRQSRGKSKTIPTAPEIRNCAGLGGGAGRTRTCNRAIMRRSSEHEPLHGTRRVRARAPASDADATRRAAFGFAPVLGYGSDATLEAFRWHAAR